jgi:hypothetical protein
MTNIQKQSGVISITVGSARPRYFPTGDKTYYFSEDGAVLYVTFGTVTFNVAFTDLRINGLTPVSVSAADTLLRVVFGT